MNLWASIINADVFSNQKVQVFRAINPKAVTRNELYGYLHPQVVTSAVIDSSCGSNYPNNVCFQLCLISFAM